MNALNLKISVIIPLVAYNDYIREAVSYYESLDYPDFEIIILPDEPESEILSKKLNIKMISSGKVGPAEKRDMGAEIAEGEILAFTDDDAYPSAEWLKKAVELFDEEDIGAVGGPAVTPENEPFWNKISGRIYSSSVMSGQYRKRYIKTGQIHEDDDLPSVNLIIRKKIFKDIGGFDSKFYPGEDTKLCLEIKKAGYRILYHPDALVYHHRRPLYPNHFAQIANYAVHRGFFVKTYPETSKRVAYFLPSLFTVGLIGGLLASYISSILNHIYLLVLLIYSLLVLISSFHINLLIWFFTALGIFLSHLVYGVHFMKGLFFVKKLKR